MIEPYVAADIDLARRLERAEGDTAREFVEARASLYPQRRACWIEAAGAYAMYDGPKSPVTQTFGLGLFGEVGAEDLDRLERFFLERGAPVYHEVCPIAGIALFELLNQRGYQPCELTSVLYRQIAPGVELAARRNPRIRVRQIGSEENELWGRTAARGWGEYEGVTGDDFLASILEIGNMNTRRPGGRAFLAELDGSAIAAASLGLAGRVALLAGACTVPEARNQGAQLAVLESRLRYAADQGCELAMMGATPGSASQRNAERQGFRIAYTRVKWCLGRPRT